MIKYPFVTTNLKTYDEAVEAKEVLAGISSVSKLKITGSAVRGQWCQTDMQIINGPTIERVLRDEFTRRGVSFEQCRFMFATKDANIFIDLWEGDEQWGSRVNQVEIRP